MNIKDFLLKNVKIIFFFILVAFLISINVVPLVRGGIYLFSEKESDTVEINGVIEDTFELSWFGGAKYGVKQNHGNGEGIIINGTKYYLVTYGELKQRDNVSIILLPKSKLILEICAV